MLINAADGKVEERVAAVVLQVEALGADLVDELGHQPEVERADDEVRRRLPRPVHLRRVGPLLDQLGHELGGVVGAVEVVPVDGAVQRRQPLLGVGVVGVGAAPEQQDADPDVVVPGGDPERGEPVLVQPRVEHPVPLVMQQGVDSLDVIEAGEVVEDGARRCWDDVLRLGVEIL